MISPGMVEWYGFKGSPCFLLLGQTKSSLADYVCIIKKAVLRRNLIRFRLGVSPLKAHRLRYTDRSQGNFIHTHFVKTLTKLKFISTI